MKVLLLHRSHSKGQSEVLVEGKDLTQLEARVGLTMSERGWHEDDCWTEGVRE